VPVRALLFMKMVAGLSPPSRWLSVGTARCASQCEPGQPSCARGCNPEKAQEHQIPRGDALADAGVGEAMQVCCASV